MTYRFSGGDLMLGEHRLKHNEALDLLDRHRDEYRRNFDLGDRPMALNALRLSSELATAMEAKSLWDRAGSIR